MSRPRGSNQSPETREKIRQTLIKRWRDPEFRARHLPNVLAAQAKARKAPRPGARVRPPMGTPEFLLYRKIAETLGIEAARAAKL